MFGKQKIVQYAEGCLPGIEMFLFFTSSWWQTVLLYLSPLFNMCNFKFLFFWKRTFPGVNFTKLGNSSVLLTLLDELIGCWSGSSITFFCFRRIEMTTLYACIACENQLESTGRQTLFRCLYTEKDFPSSFCSSEFKYEVLYDIHQTCLLVTNLVIDLWRTKVTEPMMI